MRVLIIHRYFWPDTPPYASMLRAVAGRWVADGHKVTVLTAQPSYNQQVAAVRQPATQVIDGLRVHRVWLFKESKRNFVARIANLALFMVHIFGHVVLRRRGYDVVMAATTPPVMVAWIAAIAATLRDAKFIYHCQDIHPELMKYAGLLGDGFAYRWLRNRDIQTVGRATRVVVLSRDMQETLEDRGGMSPASVVAINNFTVPVYAEEGTPNIQEAVKSPDKFRVLFAGNLGYFQGLEAVIDAAKLLRNESHIEFVFLGEGAAKNALIEQAGDLVGQTVHFQPYRPQREAEQFVKNADLSLITLGRDIYRTAFPSKTMTYLKMASPILVMVELNSELAELTANKRLGYVSPPGDAESLASNILEASQSPATTDEMRTNARAVCEELFSEQRCLDRWSLLLHEIETDRTLEPLFLIGAGRSGTRFVRNMLGASADVAAVPYDVGYVWRTGNANVPHDELAPSTLTEKTRGYIRRTLPKLARAHEKPGARILLEKSVPNSLRVDFIRAVYPDARFIHLVRDGRAVTESAIRQWQKPAETGYLLQKLRYFPWSNYRYAFWYLKNLCLARFYPQRHIWGPRYAGMEQDLASESLETICARQWKRCVETSVEQFRALPENQVLEVRYEEFLCSENVVNRICDFAGIADRDSVTGYYRNNLISGNHDKWDTNLSVEQQDMVMSEIGEFLISLGYSR